MKNKKIVIIDGNSNIHRAYHALPPLTDAEGRLMNAVYGFLKMLKKIITTEEPTHILVAFDHEKPTFRHKDYSKYKSQRVETDSELLQQIPVIYEILDLLNIRHMSFEGFEADDIIATFAARARKENIPVSIITADKDILQLVREGVTVLDGMKDKVYDEKGVKEKLGVEPRCVRDYLSLTGDKSDNLPGVRGIGPVRAKKLINEFGNIDQIYSSLQDIDDNIKKKLIKDKDNVYVTRRLVKLVQDLDLSIGIDDCLWKGPKTGELRKKLKKLNFKSLISDWVEKDELIGKLKISILRNADEISKYVKGKNSTEEVAIDPVFKENELIGLGLSFDPIDCAYIPLAHRYLSAGEQCISSDLVKILKEKILRKNTGVVAYDFKKLYKYLRRKGIEKIRAGFDCTVADYILSGESGTRTLKEISAKCLEWVPSEISGKPSDTEIEEMASLVANRVNAVFKIRDVLSDEISEAGLEELYRDVELPVLSILGEMEITGIRVDEKKLKEVEEELEEILKETERSIFSEAGEKFNINSSPQLSRILFHKLKLEPVRKTKTGYSTADDVLEELKEKHPLPAKIQKYRQIQKLLSTYIRPLPEAIDAGTGRIHTTFNITGTSTGRLSSMEPNLQNIPVRTKRGTRVRKSFVAERGNIFLSADYSQIDLRALAHISSDENLINSFTENEDIHTRTAALIYEVDEKDVSSRMRNKAKAVNFGIVYGMSAWGLEKRVDMSKDESEQFIKKYFLKYPGVNRYLKEVVQQAREKRYVTTILKRRRYLPEINSSNYIRKKSSERMAINTPIQGTSADIIKKAMVELDGEFNFNRQPLKLILQIHDELLFELPEGRETKVQATIKKIMENTLSLKVPLKVEFKKGKKWGNLKQC